MSYFLKKSNLRKGLYLQIYESYYDASKKGGRNRSFKAIGYYDDLVAQGIEDPIAYYKNEVAKMNEAQKAENENNKFREITEEPAEKYLGYFPLKNINDALGVKRYLDLMQSVTGLQFNLYSMLSALIYARVVEPCSKSKTFVDVLPKLFEATDFSLNQIYSGLGYMGLEYEKIIEIYNNQINTIFPFDTSKTYFDCTNFYFEIDKEDNFRRKGPSKENRKDPIVGLGLLLDAHQIPIGMKLFPGNQSEKPELRRVIDDLKDRNCITGRTIHVADKGLNCSENITHSLLNGDGYIFSKSVKQLPDVEKEWVLLDQDYIPVKDSLNEVKYYYKECIDDFNYDVIDKNGKKKKVTLREKRIVTFNPCLAKKQKIEIMRQVDKATKLNNYSAKKAEYGDSSKYVNFVAADKKGEAIDGKVITTMNDKKISQDLKLAGFNLLVTSEINMNAQEIYDTYHNLWRIEESFKVMKTQLDAQPVYLQKEETITGHFLICYLSVLLERILQFKILENKYSTETLFEFFRQYKVARVADRKYANLSKLTPFMKDFTEITNLPLRGYFLNNTQIKKMLSHRF